MYWYTAEWDIYALSFSNNSNYPFRIAMGSIRDHNEANKIEVIQLNKEKVTFEKKLNIDHAFPATKVMWIPDKDASHPDILASTSDCLRVWTIHDNETAELKWELENVCVLPSNARKPRSSLRR